jgi:uncharacterized membrane protein YeaQ/YmgE (transglycosylase-associated protein family)
MDVVVPPERKRTRESAHFGKSFFESRLSANHQGLARQKRVSTYLFSADPSEEFTMIGTIVGAVVLGLLVGALARLIMPGKQNIGVIVTVILGALGAFLGTWVSYKLGYSNQNGGFKIIPFLVGTVFACILIGIYLGVTGRRITNRVGRS